MKSLLLFLAVITLSLFVSSCTDNTIIPTQGTNQTDAMTFTITGSANGYTTFPAGENKPYRHFEGDGTNTPGGQSHILMDYWAIPTGALTGIAKFGNATLITETGDKIFGINLTGTYTINLTEGKVYCDCEFDIAGGTGEYDNIIGEISNLTVTINISNRYTQATWDGTFHRAKPFFGQGTVYNGTIQNPSCTTGYTRRHAEGDGTATHLGNAFFELEHCVNFSTGVMMNGNGSLKAANGDEIICEYDGYTVPIPNTNTYAVKLFATVVGGTGKYADATGFIMGNGVQTMPEGVCPFSLDGVIDW